jgi:uncharacterized protein
MELADASGRGKIYSWVTVHRALDPVFADDVPYTIVAVDLTEGPRMFGRLCGENSVPKAELEVIARVYEVRGQRLVGFAPADPGGG